MHCKSAEKNSELQPKPFEVFVGRGAVVGKSFLFATMTEYLRRVLRYPNQSFNDPSALVTASAGKVDLGVNEIMLHSTFHLPVKSGLKFCRCKQPGNNTLVLRNEYQYLKVLIIDEISMIGWGIFEHLDLTLQAIEQNSLPFSGVSLVAVGDFFELPPVNQKTVFVKARKGL